MELVSDSAVVTAVAEAGPRDRLVTFVTRSHGGLRLFARRPPRRAPLASFLEPLQGGELVFLRPREGGRARLHSFAAQRVWPGVRGDLHRTLQALAFLELLNATLAEAEPSPEVFALLVGFLDRLESERRPGLARIAASVRLLAQGGFAPHLGSCVACGSPAAAGTEVLLSPEAGGVVCRDCAARGREHTLAVSPGAHDHLARVLSQPESRTRRLRVAATVERELARLLDRYVEARTGVRPRAGATIERVEAAG